MVFRNINNFLNLNDKKWKIFYLILLKVLFEFEPETD